MKILKKLFKENVPAQCKKCNEQVIIGNWLTHQHLKMNSYRLLIYNDVTTMELKFDSEENIKAVKTPSVKVLNDVAKLWISDQCAELCKWRKDYKHLITYDINVISGNIIHNPRVIILQRSLLLKVETKTGRILRAWVAGESKEENTYTCIRKYMILLLDENNNPLHEVPLQLTATGCFQ